jgi:circadian clock protein KaiC
MHIRDSRLATGVAGLDEILSGGLPSGQAYLVRGGPGSGKTTMGLQFLAAGAGNGEKALFVTLGEPEAQIRWHAETMGLNLTGVHFLDLSPQADYFEQAESYDIFSPAEVERGPITEKIVAQIEALEPNRVCIDSMTQFRYLATDQFEYHKQAISFLRYLAERGATVVFTSEASHQAPDEDLQFIADGVINLDATETERVLTISKIRGSDYRSGRHTYTLKTGGIEVFRQLVPKDHGVAFSPDLIASGIPQLDRLLHGGLERGTSTLITGPTGTGKTTLGLQIMKEAASRGERSVVYTFEESIEILLERCERINIPVRSMMDLDILSVSRIEPLQFSPNEFADMVRTEVEKHGTRIVMLDSVAGYRLAVENQNLVSRLHALVKYLANMGVTVLLINEVENITGPFRVTNIGISYLADNIIFLRYLEIDGAIRKTIGVLKKRLSSFERSLRELSISRYGIEVGEPLTGLRGILLGEPEWVTPLKNGDL